MSMKKVSVIAAAVGVALMTNAAYAAEISLEERVAQLESQLAETSTAVEEAKTKAAEADSGFEFHAYARQGVLFNSDGVRLEKGGFHDNGAFYHPQAPFLHNYRLGNEPANYLEANLSKKWTMDDGAWAKFYSTLATHQYYAGTAYQGTNYTDNDLSFRQLYAEMGGLSFLADGSTVWAGKRYYNRQDIYQSDFIYRLMDGTGVGVQNIPVGAGQLDLAYVVADNHAPDDKDKNGKIVQHNLNAKYKGIKGLGGEFSVEATLSAAPNRADVTDTINGEAIGKPAESGFGAAVTYSRGDFFGFGNGWSAVSVMAGKGLAATYDSVATWVKNEDALGARTVAYGVWNISDKWDMMGELVYDYTQDLDTKADNEAGQKGGHTSSDYYAVGIMPVYKVSKHFAIQSQFSAEFGKVSFSGDQDYKTNKGTGDLVVRDTSAMYKATIAPTITLDSGNFWAKPTIRAFATYAQWDEEASNGGTAGYGDDDKTSGMTYGVQMEVWF